MDQKQARELVKNTLQQSFDKERFVVFVKEVLNHIDDASLVYRGNFIPDAYKKYINSLERIGKYSDGRNEIDILVMHLNKQQSLERARTSQRNMVAWYLNGSRGGKLKDAALVAFVAPNLTDWRFSLVKMEYKLEGKGHGKVKIKEKFTPAKRWSFLVGPNEHSHTAQASLAPLLEDEGVITLDRLEEAFNVEKVTNEFFEKYRELFVTLKNSLDDIVKNDAKIKKDFEARGVNNGAFAKKLLGQIVFLYFLQKKGWFGVPRGKNWGEGDKQFLRHLFEKAEQKKKDFFNDYLEPLFYKALRYDRSADDDYFSQFDCKIPFLNGGLFDPMNDYDWIRTDILLTNDIFSNDQNTKQGDTGSGILDIFDRYNFTVKEDEPLEKEVAVDPEMLGKVFENLLEAKDRKSKGTYYTPREIVHYMCQESLANYLVTELDSKVSKQDIDTLIKYGETVIDHDTRVISEGRETERYPFKLPPSVRKYVKCIDEKLASIRVCDPAVGSGAFPVGMMNEIIRTRNALTPHIGENDKRIPYNFKRQAIENCLYGVDIDPGAVEIAKLRLWLSLIVDEEKRGRIQPLPNLDYKIVCGNSLLGYPYKPTWSQEIEPLKKKFILATSPEIKKCLKNQIDSKLTGFLKNSEKSLGYKVNFDFEIFFSEVFREKKGFDVVIANPPYVGQKGNQELFSEMKNDKNFEKKMDYWFFFLHKAHYISNKNGLTTFITPNYWVTANGAKKLRNKIVNYFYFIEWINFNENNVFEAGVHTNVIILRKNEGKNKHVRCTIYNNTYSDDLISHKNTEVNFTVDQNYLYQQWTGFVHFLPKERLRIVSKLIENSLPLCDTSTIGKSREGVTAGKHLTDGICNINQGLVTGKDRHIEDDRNEGVFVVNRIEYQKFNKSDRVRLKPFYKNSDIKRYFASQSSKYYLVSVNDIDSELELKKYSSVYVHLLKYKSLLKKRSINGVLQSAYQRGKWWALTTDRPNIDFTGEKILCPQRNNINTFGYSNSEWYAASDVFYITLNKKAYSLKYILSILNSKVIYYWLYYMGKRKGDILELTLEPLQFIPIKNISLKQQQIYITDVDKILDAKRVNPEADTSELERKIDKMVYRLYGLTKEEVKIVEKDQ